MKTKAETAEKLFREGYNCAQSVAGAFCEEIGIDFNTAVRMVSGFGGGIGRMREVCGAVSGMTFVIGILMGYDDPKDVDGKKDLYAVIQTLCKEFKDITGSVICRELLSKKDAADDSPQPAERTAEYYRQRGCAGYVACAAGILEEYLCANFNKKDNI